MRLVILACVICLALAGKVAEDSGWRQLDGDVDRAVPKRVAQEAPLANLTDCLWDNGKCALRLGFVEELPSLFGQPISVSAQILARAGLRSTVCANYSGQPECLAAVQYECSWNTVADSCGLADLLDIDALQGVGFCPGSRMEAAMQCALLSNGTAQQCESSPYNCTTGAVSGWMTEAMAGGIGDRLYGMVSNSLLGMAAKSRTAAEELTFTIMSLLGINMPQLNGQGCVPLWATDTGFMGSLARGVINGVKGGNDVLSSLLTPDLLGPCEGASRLQAALAACPEAGTAAQCAATPGCRWRDLPLGPVCAVSPELLPSVVLDPADAWVSAVRNATAACRAAADAASCARVNATHAAIMGTDAPGGGGGGGGVLIGRGEGGGNAAGSVRTSCPGAVGAALALALGMVALRRYGL